MGKSPEVQGCWDRFAVSIVFVPESDEINIETVTAVRSCVSVSSLAIHEALHSGSG